VRKVHQSEWESSHSGEARILLPKESLDVALKSTYTLLTVFRHPIGTPGITSNPAILIIAEKVSHAPGIKTGKDYLLNVRELMKRTGAQILPAEPKEFTFAGRQFFRDDYGVEINGGKITQAYFAQVMKGYALVFIFMGPDQKTVDEMAKSMDTLEATPPIRTGVTTIQGGAAPKPTP